MLHILLFGMPIVAGHDCSVLVYFGLKTARCDNQDLLAVPDDLGRDIKVLSFADNGLEELTMDQFSSYPALQELYIVKNKLRTVHRDAFRGLLNLQILDLEDNELTVIPSVSFRHLRTVRILVLKKNPIKYIQANALANLPNIEEINFESCLLERIDIQAFGNLNKLTDINLVNNEIQTIDEGLQHHIPKVLKVFRIYRNPWNCNCKLRWLRIWLANSKVNWDFAQNTPACAHPDIISSVNWKHLKPEQFSCPSRILANSTTTVQLEPAQNVTVECIVFGDPAPKVTWLRGDKGVSTDYEKYTIRTMPDDAPFQFRSTLTLWQVTATDQGDYKCIADNPAGRSAVTYKLWMPRQDLQPLEGTGETYVINKELILGIAVGGAVLVLVLVICIVYGMRRRDNNRHAYKVREYKLEKGSMNNCDSEDNEKTMNAASELLLMEKKEKDKEKEPMIKRESPTSNHVLNDARTNEFKMKLFSCQGDSKDPNHKHDSRCYKTSRESEPLCKDQYKTTVLADDMREVTPDLLKNDHKTSPKGRREREENPYVIGKPKGAPGSSTLPRDTKCNGSIANKQNRDNSALKGASTLPHKDSKSDKQAQRSRHGSREDLLHRSSSGSRDSLTSPKSTSSKSSPARTPTGTNPKDTKPNSQKSTKLPNSQSFSNNMNKVPTVVTGHDDTAPKKPIKSCLKNSNNPYGTLPPNLRSNQRDPGPAAQAGVLSPHYDTLPSKSGGHHKGYPMSPVSRGSPSSSTSSRSSDPYHSVPNPKMSTISSKGGRTLVIPPPPAPPGQRSPTRPSTESRPPPVGRSSTLPRKPKGASSTIYEFPPGVSERSNKKSPEVEVMPPPGTKTDYGTTVWALCLHVNNLLSAFYTYSRANIFCMQHVLWMNRYCLSCQIIGYVQVCYHVTFACIVINET